MIGKLEPYLTKATEIKTSFITDLTVLEIIPGFETEYAKLIDLEKMKLEYPRNKFIAELTPKKQMTRDSFALQENQTIHRLKSDALFLHADPNNF